MKNNASYEHALLCAQVVALHILKDDPRNDIKDYNMTRVLGAGGFGTVVRVVKRHGDESSTSQQMVLKILRTNCNDVLRRVEQEAQAMFRVDNKHVLKIHRYFSSSTHCLYFLVLPYCDGGDLKSVINELKDKQQQMDTTLLLRRLVDIATGLSAMHDKSICHRDMKPANILLVNRGRQDECCLVTDLGVAALHDQPGVSMYSVVGTRGYMAHEVGHSQRYDKTADIWSLGVTTYEMANLKLPRPSDVQQEEYNKLIDRETSNNRIKQLLRMMIRISPRDRPTAVEVAEVAAGRRNSQVAAIHKMSVHLWDVDRVVSELNGRQMTEIADACCQLRVCGDVLLSLTQDDLYAEFPMLNEEQLEQFQLYVNEIKTQEKGIVVR